MDWTDFRKLILDRCVECGYADDNGRVVQARIIEATGLARNTISRYIKFKGVERDGPGTIKTLRLMDVLRLAVVRKEEIGKLIEEEPTVSYLFTEEMVRKMDRKILEMGYIAMSEKAVKLQAEVDRLRGDIEIAKKSLAARLG